jgi:hypothetical protein
MLVFLVAQFGKAQLARMSKVVLGDFIPFTVDPKIQGKPWDRKESQVHQAVIT